MKLIGVGTEVIECLRVARMIERHGERFIHRIFTPAEVSYCAGRSQATQHFAGRWAAKEAVLRALGVRSRRGFDWRDIEIRREKNGRLGAAFRGAARDVVERLGVGEILLSIAVCRTTAVATAVAAARPVRRKTRKKRSN